MSPPDDVAQLADKAVEAFGQVDILVHNAAIYPITFYADMTFEEWRKVMSINLDSAFLLSQAFLPGMRERKWGRIVSMTSTTFHAGSPAWCTTSPARAASSD